MMYERVGDDDNFNSVSQENKQPPFFCLKILLNSLDFFPRNKQIFFSLFTLAALPLSLLLFSFSISARPIKSHIYHLEALAHFAPTRFEARQVWKESRAEALSLLCLRFAYFIPCYFLSLTAAITAVGSTYSAVNNKRFNLHSAVNHIKLTWKRPLVTTICIYGVLVLYSQVIFFLAVLTGASPGSTLLLWVLASSFEIYLMAVLGVGLVVSVVEDRFGFDAIRLGSGLMEGRRVSGWFLSGWFVLLSGLIGWRWEKLMVDGQDIGKENWTVIMGSWEKIGLICLYGIEVLWSYIVTTIFYCECRKRHVIRIENDIDLVTV